MCIRAAGWQVLSTKQNKKARSKQSLAMPAGVL
jgi:hypothetical protein